MIEYLDSYAARFDLKPRFGEAAGSLAPAWKRVARREHVIVDQRPPCRDRIRIQCRACDSICSRDEKLQGQGHAQRRLRRRRAVCRPIGAGGRHGQHRRRDCARSRRGRRAPEHLVARRRPHRPARPVRHSDPDRGHAHDQRASGEAIDALFPFILDLALGDLSTHGLRRPQQGILQQVADAARIPVLDVGTVGKISEGAIKVVPGLSELTADGAVFVGGGSGTFDAIIFATGYRPGELSTPTPSRPTRRRSAGRAIWMQRSISWASEIPSPVCCARSPATPLRSPTVLFASDGGRRHARAVS